MVNVLFVVSDSVAPTSGDVVLRDAMLAAGHTVTLRDDGDADKTGTGYGAVVLSESCSSSALAGYKTIPEGIVCLKHSVWDAELGLTAAAFAISSSSALSFTPHAVDLVTLSGLTAEVSTPGWTVESSVRVARNNTSFFPTGTEYIDVAQFDQGLSTDMFAFAYEAGAVLADTTTAAGRRVAMGLNDGGVPNITPQMEALLNGAILWASGENPGGGGDTTPPSVPGSLTATPSGNDVALAWLPSTDDVGVDHYDVYRSTSAGFTPAIGNRIGQPTTNAYTDLDLANGTYYYRVVAVDAASNASAASNEASAVVNVPAEDPGALLWAADLTQATITAAFEATVTDSDATNLSYGSLVDTDLDGEPRAFRALVQEAAKGYRFHTEGAVAASPHFPRDEVVLRFKFRIDTMGGIATADDVKFGYGLAGGPAGAALADISYGGSKFAGSWSFRLATNRPNYIRTGVPDVLGVSAYLYAEQADGIDIDSTANSTKVYGTAFGSTYGLRVPFKNGGSYFSPVEDQVYAVEIRVQKNTPGVEDGLFVALIDGVEYANVPVMWNPAGQDVPVGYLISQTFSNTAITQGVFHLGAPALYAAGTPATVVSDVQVWDGTAWRPIEPLTYDVTWR